MEIKSIHTQMRHEMGDKKLFEQAKTYAFDDMDTIAASIEAFVRARKEVVENDQPL